MNYQATNGDEYMPAHAGMHFNRSTDLDLIADHHLELLGVLSSHDEETTEVPTRRSASLLKDSPLQAYLRTKNLENSQSTAQTCMTSTHHTGDMSSTQHTLNAENHAWRVSPSHDVDDDESLYSFAAEDLLDASSNGIDGDEEFRLEFSSDSLDLRPCVITLHDDVDVVDVYGDEEETQESAALCNNDSMSSLNDAFGNLSKCMERTARTRALLKSLPDRHLLSHDHSAHSLNVSGHSVSSFNSSYNSGYSLPSSTSRNPITTTTMGAAERQNARWPHPKSDAVRGRRRLTKSKASQVIKKDRRMMHNSSGLVKARVDSKKGIASHNDSQGSLCSTGSSAASLNGWKVSSSSPRIGRRTLLCKATTHSTNSSISADAPPPRMARQSSVDQALQLLESNDCTSRMDTDL